MAKNPLSSILDELMGRDRNALPDEIPKEVSWDDPEICTHYMVCFCPNELFVNTKADLGTCNRVHDEQLRKKYVEDAPNNKKLQFENEFIRFAEKMVKDIEGKISRGKMRIALANGPDGGTYAGPGSKNAEKIALLTERINGIIKEAEEAGCAGDIEKAQGLLKLCDQLKEEREQMKSNEVNHPWNPDKAMQVCEVCGSYLIIGEAQHRLDDHIMGKQHMGFALLRKTMDDVKKARDARDMEEKERIEKERKERRWGAGGGGGGGRDYHRGRDRDRKRSKSRSRSKDRDRVKKKKRSRSPRRRSRSRDRKKDKKDKDRDSSRDRKSRRHSDEKKRHKRSRSRSRDRRRKRSKSRSRSRSGSHDKHRNKKEKDLQENEENNKTKDKDDEQNSHKPDTSNNDSNSNVGSDMKSDAQRAADDAEFLAAMKEFQTEASTSSSSNTRITTPPPGEEDP